MKDTKKTKAQLIAELEELQKQNAEFYAKEAEYKKVDEELLKRSQLFKTVFHSAPIGLALNEIDGEKLIIANETFWEAYKVPKEACKTISDFFTYVYGDRMVLGQQILDDQASGDPARMRWDSIPIIDKETGETSYVSAINLVLKDHNLMISTVLDITERKKADKRIEFLSSITENITDSIIVTDTNFTITYANKAFEELFGYKSDELKGKTPDILNAEPTAPEIQQEIYQTVSSGDTLLGESLNKRKDGSTFYCEYEVMPLKDEQGNIYSYVGIQRNITERKKAEEVLKKSEAKFRNLYNSSPIGYHSVDAKGVLLDINKTELEWLSYKKKEIIEKKTIFDLQTKESAKRGKAFFKQLKKKGRVKNIELEMKRKDGTEFPVIINASVICDENEKFIMSNSTVIDITEHKKAEEELRESEEKYRTMFNINPDVQYQLNMNGEITIINKRVKSLSDYEPEELIGKKFSKLVSPEDQAKYGAGVERRTGGRATRGIELRVVGREGKVTDAELLWTEISAAGVYENGYVGNGRKSSRGQATRYIGTQGTIRDITERKKAVESLRESEEKYRSLFEKMINGYAYCKMIFDKDNKPIDWIYIDVNDSFERITGLKKDVIGKKVTEAIPGIKEDVPELFEFYGKVALTGKEASFEIYLDTLQTWFSVMVFCPQKGCFVAVFEDITKQKKAEEALKEKIVELNSFINNIPDMAWVMDIESRFIAANTAFGKAVGKDPGTLVNKGYEVCFGKKGGKKLREDDMNVIKSRNQIIFEEKINIDNNTIWLETIKSPIFDNSEKVIGTVGIARNITKRKQAEEALRESEERYKRITDEVTDYIFTVQIEDGQPVKTTHSPASIAVTGYIPEEFAAEPDLWIRMVHDNDRAAVIEQASRILTGKSVEPLEHRIICQSGKTCWVRNTLVPHYDAQGKLLSYDGLISDITERKKAEEALRMAQKYSSNLIDSSLDMIISVDINRRIVEFNNAAQVTFGYSKEEIIGKSIDLLYADSAEGLKVHNTTRREGQFSGEILNKRKNGELFPSFLSSSVLEDESGKFLGIMGVSGDITDLKQLEEERTKTEKLESIGILAGGIAHDFNNILTVILGNVSLAKMRIDSKSEEYEVLKEAENASYRAKDLTQQLLTFAKGGAPIKETTELTELIRDTVKFSIIGSNVQYSTSFTPDLWPSDVNNGQINQAINNLAINAQQAMPEGGTINITAENVSITPGDNLPLQKGNYIKISIKDKGIGISEDHLTKIFDPYFTTKQLGSGLGLATTYSIIKRHGGHIAVESELGVGTTFHIYLSASSKEVEGKEVVKEDTAVLTGKILVMDDEPEIRKIVSETLTLGGSEVKVACDGTEAIKLYKKAMGSGKPFDVVIMDLTIPGGMGGKKAVKKLLEIDPDAKAVVSSGYANDPVISNFEEYGFSGFIPKPYKIDELKRVINEVLSKEND